MTESLLITHGLVFLPDGQLSLRHLRVVDGRITEISKKLLQRMDGEREICAKEFIITPGLINAHTHSPLSSLKGTTDRMGHPEFMWTNQVDTFNRSPEVVEAATTIAAADMLRQGITSVIDNVPEQNADYASVAPVVNAWKHSRMRCAISLRQFDQPYTDIGPVDPRLTENPLAPKSIEDITGIAIEAIKSWHDPNRGLSVMVGPSNTERCSDNLLLALYSIAEENDVQFHGHFCETKIQVEQRKMIDGRTPTERLMDLNILSKRCCFAHCVWLSESDIISFADTGAIAIHNPNSNCKLGVGLMPLGAMFEAGVKIALATDGASTNDTLNMHEAMALALYLQRASSQITKSNWLTANDSLNFSTLGGACALGMPNSVGQIKEGAWADLVFYDRFSIDLYPLNNFVEQLVFAERGNSVAMTMVAGKMIYDRQCSVSPRIRDAQDVLAEDRRIRLDK